MVAVGVLILIPPLVWALTIFLNILAAMSIGGILLVAAFVWLFVALKNRVDEA